MTEPRLEEILTMARHDHVVPGREIHMQGMHGYRFCELGLMTGARQDDVISNIWNTTGACDLTPEQFDGLNVETIAHDGGALQAWVSPERSWMIDRLDVREVGEDRTFGNITGTWMGVLDAATMQATTRNSYEPGYVHRDSILTFCAGTEVFLLDAPDGEVFVLQSLTRHRALTEGNLAHLGSRLDLPDGWGFRTELLDQDLEILSNNDNLVHVMQDDLQNVYQGSDVGRAFSRLTTPDSLR